MSAKIEIDSETDTGESDLSDFENSEDDYMPVESTSDESSDDDSDCVVASDNEVMEVEMDENSNRQDDLHGIQDEPVWTEYQGRQKYFRFTGACIIINFVQFSTK